MHFEGFYFKIPGKEHKQQAKYQRENLWVLARMGTADLDLHTFTQGENCTNLL